MNIKQNGELKTYLKNAITKGGRVDTESLSKAILRAAELVIEERDRTLCRKIQNWVKPSVLRPLRSNIKREKARIRSALARNASRGF